MTKTIEEVFADVNGATFIGVDTETKTALKGGKSNPMKDRVTKRTYRMNVMVFQNKDKNGYEEMVKRRLVAEGKDPSSFSVGPRPWGTRIDETPFIEHNGKKYIEVIVLSSGESEYLLDGWPIDADKIEGLDKTVVNPRKEEDEKAVPQGGLENQVCVRTFAFESIRRLVVNGEEYRFTA